MIEATDVIRWSDGDDVLMINFGENMPLLYCDTVSIQTQTLRFMRCGEGRASTKYKAWPKDLSPWGLSIYGRIQKIERRMPTAQHRGKMILEAYERYGITLDAKWAVVVRNGVVRLSNGKAEIKEDFYGISLRCSKGFRPYPGKELAFDDHHHLLIPMTEVMEMLQSRLGLLVDPLAWQKQSNFGKNTTEVLVVNRRK
jgi:hypothetical protein